MYFTLFQQTCGALWVNICSLVSTSLEALKPSLLNILQKRNIGQDRKYFSNLGGGLLCDTLAQTTLKHAYRLFMIQFYFKAIVEFCFIFKTAKVSWPRSGQEWAGKQNSTTNLNGQLNDNAVTM